MQINNPDQRVVILKEFVQHSFPSCPLLEYALEVEKVTTAKVIYYITWYLFCNCIDLNLISITNEDFEGFLTFFSAIMKLI